MELRWHVSIQYKSQGTAVCSKLLTFSQKYSFFRKCKEKYDYIRVSKCSTEAQNPASKFSQPSLLRYWLRPLVRASAILLGAPNVGNGFYGMSQTALAAEFKLSGSEYVTTVNVVLLGGGGLYDFALQNSLTGSIATFASAVITVPTAGQNTEAITVNATLTAGTYYLVGSKDPADTVPGWWLSDGTYVTNAGSVTNGVWDSSSLTGPWGFQGPSVGNSGDYAPAFTVNGSAAAVPEPSSLLLLGGCVLLGILAMARHRVSVD